MNINRGLQREAQYSMKPRIATEFTRKELITVFMSRLIKDGENVTVGAALAIPRAAALLAHLHHGPNMTVQYARTRTNLFHVPVLEPFQFLTDWRGSRWAESYYIHEEAYDAITKVTDSFFIGGLQVDKFGNSNLIGIGKKYGKLKLKGPGAVGTCTLSTMVSRYYIFLNNHDRRTLVEKCDFISAYGWGSGGADSRKKWRLPGGGPEFCITPLCVMDFEPNSKRMRLKSIHAGVTTEEVVENMGFEPIIPSEVPFTCPPYEEELEVLRQRVDPKGELRT